MVFTRFFAVPGGLLLRDHVQPVLAQMHDADPSILVSYDCRPFSQSPHPNATMFFIHIFLYLSVTVELAPVRFA